MLHIISKQWVSITIIIMFRKKEKNRGRERGREGQRKGDRERKRTYP